MIPTRGKVVFSFFFSFLDLLYGILDRYDDDEDRDNDNDNDSDRDRDGALPVTVQDGLCKQRDVVLESPIFLRGMRIFPVSKKWGAGTG